jgi:pSer/pThr/pTyr-binding forkhead associated (FHA) protein
VKCSTTYELLIGKELYILVEDVYTVGRSSSCDIHLKTDQQLARIHCTIAKGCSGNYQITDGDTLSGKPSSNGMKINGVKLNINYAHELIDGDEIELSPSTKIKFFSRINELLIDADSTLL